MRRFSTLRAAKGELEKMKKEVIFNEKVEKSVGVRFAPSPTGNLHLGGLRTALYNYLYAKSKSGQFLLGIEDTDKTREVDGAVDRLIEDLKWIGLEWDEGPDKEGEFGPYV